MEWHALLHKQPRTVLLARADRGIEHADRFEGGVSFRSESSAAVHSIAPCMLYVTDICVHPRLYGEGD